MADEPSAELIPAAGASGAPREQLFASGMPPGMPPEEAPKGDENTVTPEEQGQYDQLVAKVGKFLWSDKRGQQRVLTQLNQTGREFFENAGQAAYQLVSAEVRKAKAAGVELSADAAFHAAADYVVPWLFELAEAAKIVTFKDPQQEDQQKQMTLMEAARLHGEATLKGADGPARSAEAQDFYAEKVAQESDAGELSPGFSQTVKPARPPGSSVAAGVRSALQEMGRGQ